MKRISIIGGLLLLTLGLSACGNTNNKTTTNTTGNVTTNVANENFNNTKNIKKENKDSLIVYLDKNCTATSVGQCNPLIIKNLLISQIGIKGKVEIKNFDDATRQFAIKNNLTTPYIIFTENILNDLSEETSKGIKELSKKVGDKYYFSLYIWEVGKENNCNDGKDNNSDGLIDEKDSTCKRITLLSSKNCKEKYCDENYLKKTLLNNLLGYKYNIINIETEEGKRIYEGLKKKGIYYLPAILFNEKKGYFNNINNFITELTGFNYKYELSYPIFKYDPSIEACASDCNASPSCKKRLSCNKSDKPKVELFVMSYCPFGTQAEKGILPVINSLKDKIDFKVKFVNYAMHGNKEIDENNLQYCIQQEELTKYNDYLTCFLEAGNKDECIKRTNINMNKINKCVDNVKEKFKTEKDFNNKSTWLNGQFPMYRVYNDLNEKYDVKGSPTLIINGVKVQPKSRSSQSYLDIVCSAFKKAPEECKKTLSNNSYIPNFGWKETGTNTSTKANCGGK